LNINNLIIYKKKKKKKKFYNNINLGKFGSFKANSIIGKPYGITYEIVNKNDVKLYKNYTFFDDFGILFYVNKKKKKKKKIF